jgi:3D (Asp-Asp-Asp) domain-containing protein
MCFKQEENMKQQPLVAPIAIVVIGVFAVVGILRSYPSNPPPTSSIPTPTIVIENHQSTTFEATGYAIGHPYNTITKNGQPVINKGFMQVGGVDIFTIAVDPKIIPLGSLVYIDSLGLALATDTGREIKGMLIDICFTNIDEAMEWGRKDVQVYVLKRSK